MAGSVQLAGIKSSVKFMWLMDSIAFFYIEPDFRSFI